MQWIFMLVGLVLGALADETLTASLIGALFGLGLAQALRLQGLSRENAALMTQLTEVSKRFAERAAAVDERVRQLEQGGASQAVSQAEPEAETAPKPAMAPEQTAPVELDWTLDFVLPDPPAEPIVSAAQPALSPEPERVTPTASPWVPSEPRAPGVFAQGFNAAKNWLLGGNTVLRVGVVLLFLGLAFLLRYATEGVVVPVEFRYASVAASAVAL